MSFNWLNDKIVASGSGICGGLLKGGVLLDSGITITKCFEVLVFAMISAFGGLVMKRLFEYLFPKKKDV